MYLVHGFFKWHLSNGLTLVSFFHSLSGVVFGSHIGESDSLLLCALFPVTYFPFRVETNHQLVYHYTNEGTEEWSKNRDQEPALSNPGQRQNKS